MKIFFTISVVLLIKQTLSETQNISTSSQLSSNERAFHSAIIAELVTLSEEPIKLGKQCFEDAYADKSNSEDATRALADFINDTKNIKLNIPVNRITIFLWFGLIFDVFANNTNADDGLESEKDFFALKEALERHDVKAVANLYRRKFDEFLDWMTKELEAKGYNLTEEEQIRVNSLKVLWFQFKEDTIYEKRKEFLRDIMRRVKSYIVDE